MLFCLFLAGWERSHLLTLLCVKFYFGFATFTYGVPGPVWYLIVSIANHFLFHLSVLLLNGAHYNVAYITK